jgi:very-short-patch-repair endonuclease
MTILPGTGRGTAEGGGGGLRQLLRPEVATARKLRRTMSLPEVLLWERLRGGKADAKFRRQHPVGPYVADFYCSAVRLVIEIDGEAHDRAGQLEGDPGRDAFLKQNGYQVLRVSAAEVMESPDDVASMIGARVIGVARGAAPLHRCAVPLSASGEEL